MKGIWVLTALACLAVGPNRAVAATVGIRPCDGLTLFVKEFTLPAGTMISGVVFENNDARTVFPEVILVYGDESRLSDGEVIARAANARETGEGRVTVMWSAPVTTTEPGTYRIAVRFPEGAGKLGDGNGPAIGAVRAAPPTACFVAGGPDGELTPVNLDLNMQILTQAPDQFALHNLDDQSHATWRTSLAGGVPNPGSGSTNIRFSLERRGPTRLCLYDVSGRVVRVLSDIVRDAGVHSCHWDGRDEGGARVPAGIYVAKLQACNQTLSWKIVVTR